MCELGSVYGQVGMHSLAVDLLTRALAITRSVLGNDHPDTARLSWNLEVMQTAAAAAQQQQQ